VPRMGAEMSIEAMKLALDALEQHGTPLLNHEDAYWVSLTTLRQAIEAAEKKSAFTNGEAGTEKCPPGGGGYPGIKSSRLIVEGNK